MVTLLHLNGHRLGSQLLCRSLNLPLKSIDLVDVLNLVVSLLAANLLLLYAAHQDVVLRQQSKVPQLESHLELESLKSIVVVLCDLLLEHLVRLEVGRLLRAVSFEYGRLCLG
jgi:hypothetical protein